MRVIPVLVREARAEDEQRALRLGVDLFGLEVTLRELPGQPAQRRQLLAARDVAEGALEGDVDFRPATFPGLVVPLDELWTVPS